MWAVVVAVGAATALIAALPSLSFAYSGETAHVVIETAGTLVSLLAAFILLGRVRQTPSRSELLLFVGLLVFFVANLARAVSPSYTGANEAVVWIPLTANMLAAVILMLAAFASDRRVSRGAGLRITGAALLFAAAAMLVVGLASDRLSTGIDPGISPPDVEGTLVVGSPGLLGAQAASMALFALAALGFSRRAGRSQDEFLGWLALGLALASLSRLNYFLFPSIYSDWVFTGDILRLGSYLAILIGALRQIAAYQRSAAEAAVLADRNRIARDLHDTLAQDLAYISLQGERIAARDERAADLARTARLALAASRGAIEHLRRSEDPLDAALERMARAMATRHGVQLALALEDGVETAPAERDELLLIAGEAISNAVRHGDPAEIRVELMRGDARVRLAISDDGTGFDPQFADPERPGGLGLAGIRARAERLGGRCRVSSRPGEGTKVEVVLS